MDNQCLLDISEAELMNLKKSYPNQDMKNREKYTNKIEQHFWGLQEKYKIRIVGLPEAKERKRQKKCFLKNMGKVFIKFEKDN